MQRLRQTWVASPVWARVVPLAVFLLLTFLQGHCGETGRYWIYLGKTLAGLWLVWLTRPFVAELKWKVSAEAIGVGVLMFVAWVGLSGLYPKFSEKAVPWNPLAHFAENPALGWFFVAQRLLGTMLVVPMLEEVFYRSFLYRWVVRPDFATVPLNQFQLKALLVTSAIFALNHDPASWLPAMLCGLSYQWLVLRKNRLGDALTAHAVTNLLLGIWVVWRGAWHFW